MSDSPSSIASSGLRAPHLALVLAVLATLGAALVVAPAAPLSGDGAVYGAMAASLARQGSLALPPGLEGLGIAEVVRVPGSDGVSRLQGRYPPAHPVAAALLMPYLGLRGPILLNALAFIVVLVVTSRLARLLGAAPTTCRLAACMVALASFAPEYALEVWPHMAAAATVAAAVLMAAGPVTRARGALAGLAAGTAAGLGIAVRLDAVLALPGLVVALVLRHGRRAAVPVGALVLGLSPWLAGLAMVNAARFGTPSPLSYGPSSGATQGLAAYGSRLVALAACALMFLVLLGLRRVIRRPVHLIVLFAVIVGGTLTAVPDVRVVVGRTIMGSAHLVVDLRDWGDGGLVGGHGRTSSGALIYAGVLKKSLMQSCPWILISILGLGRGLSDEGARPVAAALAVVMVSWLAFYGSRSWHGGLSFNLRYFLPLLSPLAVLTALGLQAPVELLGRRRSAGLLAAGAVAYVACMCLALATAPSRTSWPLERAFLDLPLLLALPTGLAIVLWQPPGARAPSDSRPRAGLLLALAGACLFAGTMAGAFDAAASLRRRAAYAATSRTVTRLLRDGPITLVCDFPDPFYPLAARSDVTFRAVRPDDLPALKDHLGRAMADGGGVVVACSPSSLDAVCTWAGTGSSSFTRIPVPTGTLLYVPARSGAPAPEGT